jgi:hypothetical protein
MVCNMHIFAIFFPVSIVPLFSDHVIKWFSECQVGSLISQEGLIFLFSELVTAAGPLILVDFVW